MLFVLLGEGEGERRGTLGAAQTRQGSDSPAPFVDGGCVKGERVLKGCTHCTFGARVLMFL